MWVQPVSKIWAKVGSIIFTNVLLLTICSNSVRPNYIYWWISLPNPSTAEPGLSRTRCLLKFMWLGYFCQFTIFKPFLLVHSAVTLSNLGSIIASIQDGHCISRHHLFFQSSSYCENHHKSLNHLWPNTALHLIVKILFKHQRILANSWPLGHHKSHPSPSHCQPHSPILHFHRKNRLRFKYFQPVEHARDHNLGHPFENPS